MQTVCFNFKLFFATQKIIYWNSFLINAGQYSGTFFFGEILRHWTRAKPTLTES